MQNGLIHDSQITASSHKYHSTSPPSGRLHQQVSHTTNQLAGWCIDSGDPDPWFQVDFIAKVFVDEVQTQGRGDKISYVETYNLLYGDDGDNFTEYSENGPPKVCNIPVACMSYLYVELDLQGVPKKVEPM